MPIISGIRRRSFSLRAQVFIIYAVLTLGAVTMVYPFLVMVSGSFKSRVDSTSFDTIPSYFRDDGMLFKKYVEARYNEDLLFFNSCTGYGAMTFAEIMPPKKVNTALVREWNEFTTHARLPDYFYQLGQTQTLSNGFMPLLRRDYVQYADRQFHGDLDAYNRKLSTTATAWFYAAPYVERYIDKRYAADDGEAYGLFLKFKRSRNEWHRIYTSVENMYRYNFLSLKYGSDTGDYNKWRHTAFRTYNNVILSPTVPPRGPERADWLEFVRENLNRVFIETTPSAVEAYRSMLKKKYDNNIGKLSEVYGSRYGSFNEVQLPADKSRVGATTVDFDMFVKTCDPKLLRLTGPDFLFKRYLENKHGSISTLNRSLHTHLSSFDAVQIPALEADWQTMQSHKSEIRWEFVSRNYKMVLSYILLHGRGIVNTLIFCVLAIIIALTVNPVAAYAMSRYNLPTSYKVLLFMMATMAFPSAVTMIPNFLLLKQLHLLNTFWALVLPGVASGYSIFLLKGFFDSLPRDLYEAAMLDGAGEWTMFWRITMALSKPILAVLALGAFTAAYGSFLYAFTVCQDQSMWTLMVWLFQLQQSGANPAVTYAGLIIAAVPTLIVFVLSQNVIMRGIIVPQEK